MPKHSSQLAVEFLDEEYRYAYAEDFLNAWIATQIVTLREQRRLKQGDLGKLIGTKQPGVSRLEDVNHSTWKIETLKRIARALGVRLRVSFETFGTLLIEDAWFSRKNLERPKFEDDPAFTAVDASEDIEPPVPPVAPAKEEATDTVYGIQLSDKDSTLHQVKTNGYASTGTMSLEEDGTEYIGSSPYFPSQGNEIRRGEEANG